MQAYTAVVEKCPDTNLYVGYVPRFPGTHSQAESLDELQANPRGHRDASGGGLPGGWQGARV